MAPEQVQSILDEPRVRKARQILASKMTEKQRLKYQPPIDSYKDMIKYASDTTEPFWKVGEFCYKDQTPKQFRKGTDEKRSKVYIIERVVKNRRVKRYFLVDLNFKAVTGECANHFSQYLIGIY